MAKKVLAVASEPLSPEVLKSALGEPAASSAEVLVVAPALASKTRMILSDREARAARARAALRITPEPAPSAWSSTAVDLTLDGPLSCWEVPEDQRVQLLICLHGADFDFAALSRQFGREAPLVSKGTS